MIAALLALTVLALPPKPAAQAPAKAGPKILVVPFEPPGRDGRTYWLGEAVSVLIANDVTARGLGAIPRQMREHAYEQLRLPLHAVLSRATVIKVGELVGATEVIVGSVDVAGDTLTIRATPIRVDLGRADSDIVEHGTLNDLMTVARTIARRVVPENADAPVPATPPLHAFEQFVKGLLAERPASQAEFLESAIKIDPHYDPRAWRCGTSARPRGTTPPRSRRRVRYLPMLRRALAPGSSSYCLSEMSESDARRRSAS